MAPAGSKLPQPLVVQLLDQGGNPIANQPVSWVVGDGGGTANPETSNTDANGQASTEWTLGPNPGTNTLNAVVSGLTPAAFRATGTGTGTPSTLAVTTQPPSSVTVGATLSPAPVVQVRDASGTRRGGSREWRSPWVSPKATASLTERKPLRPTETAGLSSTI